MKTRHNFHGKICVEKEEKIIILCKPWSLCQAQTLIKESIHLMICFLFVCLGLTSLWNTWGHITTVPACSSGTLTKVLPHRNAMPQTQGMTPHPVTVYRHGADLSCYPLMWNVTLEYTTTNLNVLSKTGPGNHSLTFHTHTSECSSPWCWYGGSQSETR